MICLSNESFDKEVMNIGMLSNGSVDGLIVSMSKETQRNKNYDHLNELIDNDFPLVMFDRIKEELKWNMSTIMFKIIIFRDHAFVN